MRSLGERAAGGHDPAMIFDAGTLVPSMDVLVRLAVATVGGLLLGLDREVRGKAAGVRTHGLVSLSSAVITVSALMLYAETRHDEGGDMDPLRVIQGLAQAIGFIAAGMIIVAKGDVQNLTSAANLWLAAALGIAAGAGQFGLVIAAFVFGVGILTVIRFVERLVPGARHAEDD